MSEYRAIITNFKTGAITSEAPVISLSATNELNGAGAITFTVPLVYAPAIETSLTVDHSGLQSVENYAPAKSAVFIERDGVILFGGIVWGLPSIDIATETVSVSCAGMLSYLRRRLVRTDLSVSSADQDTIAAEVVARADGVAIDSVTNATGVTRDFYVYGSDQLTVEQALMKLATADNGFDFYFTHSRSGNTITSSFRTQYPASGRATNSVIESHQCSSFRVEHDGGSMANVVDARGALVGENTIVETVADTAVTATTPQLDGKVYVDAVTDRSLLREIAQRTLKRTAQKITRVSLTKSPDEGIALNSYLIGDRVRVRAQAGGLDLDGTFRIVSDGLTVDENGRENHSLILVGEESFRVPDPVVPVPEGGNWVGLIGTSGYALFGHELFNFPDATFSEGAGTGFIYENPSVDTRALTDPTGTTRIAGIRFGGATTAQTLTFTTAWSGTVNVYIVDWDDAGRSEFVTLSGSNISNRVTETYSDFSAGQWVTFSNVSMEVGHTMTITTTRVSGSNSVISGIFLD